MNNVVKTYLLNKKDNGIEYYLNILEEDVYKKFEREYEHITTTLDVNKFEDRWDVKPSEVLSYGASPFKEIMSREDREEFIKLLEGIMPKPEFRYNTVYGKQMKCYKCWCIDRFPILELAGHNNVLSSFNCLLTKLHKPDYLVITYEKPKTN